MSDYRTSDLMRLLVRSGLGATGGAGRAEIKAAERREALYAGVGREGVSPVGETGEGARHDGRASRGFQDEPSPAPKRRPVLHVVVDNGRKRRGGVRPRPLLALVKG